MAPAAIRPGIRKALAASAAFLILAAAGAAAGAGLLSRTVTCPDELSPTDGQPATLELDYLADTNAIIARTDPNCTLVRAVAPLKLNLSVLTNREAFTPRDANDCLYPAEADSLVCGTLTWDTAWTAHGVVVPNPAVYEMGATGEWVCPGDRLGMIWLLPPCGSSTSTTSKTWVSGFRKHFLAFWQPDDRDAAARDRQAFITNVHELGHVLNMHHCEFYNADDKLDDYGIFTTTGKCMAHMKELGKNEKHVMPGTTTDAGLSFCDYNRTHWKLHGKEICCETERLDEPASESVALELQTLHKKLVLNVTAEKSRYFPGEPIHLNLWLKPRAPGADLTGYDYLPGSLNPDLGHLFISVKSKSRFGSFDTLGPAFLQEPRSAAPVPFDPNGIKRDGVGIWFTLSDSGRSPRKKPFLLKARFAGFRNAALHLESTPAEIVVNTQNTSPGLYSDTAYEIFMHPAARQFLFLLGGDHLKSGFEDLSLISAQHGQTIYSPYADIALGVYWARPFKGLNANGAPITRDADLNKARHHLLKAKTWDAGHAGDASTELPPSWKAILETTLAHLKTATGGRT